MGAPRVSEPRGPGEKSRGHPIVSEGFFPRIKDALFQLNILQTVVFSDHTLVSPKPQGGGGHTQCAEKN